MNELVFFAAVFGLHGAAIVVAVVVALRAQNDRSRGSSAIGP